jgi:hypothetical protein
MPTEEIAEVPHVPELRQYDTIRSAAEGEARFKHHVGS